MRYTVKVMKFVDTALVQVNAGKGGDGHLSFRRTRGNAKGGPDGGDGGHGGNVILRADHNSSTLSRYRTNRQWKADAGESGSKNNRHGKNGADIVLAVPPGTIALDGDKVVAELRHDGQEQVIAAGGRGGYGNAHFVSSVRQAPKIAELGEAGQSFELTLELKLVADVGLVGLPNAGKSTLLSVVSAARPRIADYPFTTLTPNLGVVEVDDASFLAADIPGLIAGAALGKGLGDEFLRHVERTKLLLHLVDSTSSDVVADYQTIRNELAAYKVDLSKYPSLVVLNKIDALSSEQVKQKVAALKRVVPKGAAVLAISAVAHQQTTELVRAAARQLAKLKSAQKTEDTIDQPTVITLDDQKSWQVEQTEAGFVVTGKHLESIAARTNFSQPQAVIRLRDVLKKEGVLRELRRRGAIDGDRIQIGKRELEL